MTWRRMSGAGNVFMVGTREDKALGLDNIDTAGVEGYLTIDSQSTNKFEASFFNPDGSAGMMCGNGSRCVVRYALDMGVKPVGRTVYFSLNGIGYAATVVDTDIIAVTFPPPVTERSYPAGSLQDVEEDVYYVDVNSDHIVLTGSLDASRPIVQTLRHHSEFPRGVNVNLAEISGPDLISYLTFERGVESITGACGTGALATAVCLWRKGKVSSNVTLIPPSKKPIQVEIHFHDKIIYEMILIGDVVYED